MNLHSVMLSLTFPAFPHKSKRGGWHEANRLKNRPPSVPLTQGSQSLALGLVLNAAPHLQTFWAKPLHLQAGSARLRRGTQRKLKLRHRAQAKPLALQSRATRRTTDRNVAGIQTRL